MPRDSLVRHDSGVLRGARYIVVIVAGTAIAAAPSAHASGADEVVADLRAEGYNVNINWLNGFNTQQLSDCTVVGVNNPSSSPAGPMPGDTVYVDVTCPNDLY
jgi:hypothetical protein